MRIIKILGTGCANCKRTEAVVNTVISELSLKDIQVIKVEDIQDIMTYDIMSTPAVVLDEKVVIKGRVPSFDEIKSLLNQEDACCSETDTSCCEPKDASDSCCDTNSSNTGCC